MKTSLLCLLISFMFLGGCLDSGYKHIKYDPLTGKVIEKWELSYAKAMTTSTITDVNLCLSDGSSLSFGKSVFIYDGNDWEHIGNAGGKILSGGILFLIPK